MDMNLENVIAEPEEYSDEVLNASWLPPPTPPETAQPLLEPVATVDAPPLDADSFLQAVYRYQE